MDTRVLNYFLLTASEANITKTAGLLHITQPTLSRQLKALEDELGVQLFRREHHRLELTDAGILFRQRARDLVSIEKRAKEELAQTGILAGEIAIGVSELQSLSELSQLIAKFHLSHPLVHIALHSGNNMELQYWLERGSIDMALMLEPVDVKNYEFVRMHQAEEWGVLVPETSSFFAYSEIVPGDLVGTPVITILDEVVQRELASWSGQYASQMSNWARYNLLSSAVMLAQQTQGVIVCLKLPQEFPNMRFIPLNPVLSLKSIVAWRAKRPHTKATAAFIEQLLAHDSEN
ncbi:LysR family transcriptional regulator [Agrilactobacillus yilanensis]|uniref:LysR family transcriptional regulator n=1 Tax=Agrilactobacillus yilanensis TaxID=2485997 RepID=A0ABW4J3L3_9LACO|nr:LysR family transcriptional regulator [Agrilactobacillus yilanensis]